jgi:NAD(P)H-hydrate epimerase
MVLTVPQMLEAERCAFAAGASAESLMEQAGKHIAACVAQFHPRPGHCIVFAGKGHNGGDVLAAARHLAAMGWGTETVEVFPKSKLAPLTALQFDLLKPGTPASRRPLVVLDGLLGIGAQGEPRGPVAQSIHLINQLRAGEAAWVLSADIPSGLGSDTCVAADATATVGFAKAPLLEDSATDFVGRIMVAPLDGLEAPAEADPAEVLSACSLRQHLPPRPFDMHKGMCGRVAIAAGSANHPGAARLCSAAAVAGGAGLVTLFVPPESLATISPSTIPEVMVSPLENAFDILGKKFDSLAVGPGFGRGRDGLVLELVRDFPGPSVVDADALNAVATALPLLDSCFGPRLLTPHPLEMERLSPRQSRTRREWLADFTSEYPVCLLLKGARTLIGENGSLPAYNTTGHPGMATGGMGDVLTGVAAALLAQGKTTAVAAKLAAWVCGRSAELALRDGGASQESLRAWNVVEFLGGAFRDLRDGVY